MSCPKLVLQGLSWSDPSLFVLWRFWHNSLVSCVECFSPSKSQNDKIRKKIKKICSCCECQLPLSSEWMVALLFLTTFSFKSNPLLISIDTSFSQEPFGWKFRFCSKFLRSRPRRFSLFFYKTKKPSSQWYIKAS
jgi:hypothetical protein